MIQSTVARILLGSTLVLGVLFSPEAHATKTIQLKLLNSTNDTPMTCDVHRVVTNTSGTDVATKLRTFQVTPKDDRPSSQHNTPETFTLSVKYIIKRPDGSVVYPRLKLTCRLQGQNSEQSSPLWDHAQKPFDTNRFKGSCRSGAYCQTIVESK